MNDKIYKDIEEAKKKLSDTLNAINREKIEQEELVKKTFLLKNDLKLVEEKTKQTEKGIDKLNLRIEELNLLVSAKEEENNELLKKNNELKVELSNLKKSKDEIKEAVNAIYDEKMMIATNFQLKLNNTITKFKEEVESINKSLKELK